MLADPKLLVVDDEDAICEGCRRIFSRQGFEVEKTTDAAKGLSMAADGNYAAVLVDIKMPEMDGIEFLEKLRGKKPQLPVILMTGYPSIPNAVSAIRLGASGYVTKPFTPEEISEAVHKHVHSERPQPPAREVFAATGEGVSFWSEAWMATGEDGSVRAGVMLPANAAKVQVTRLPRIGEVAYQGLPMASLKLANGSEKIVPAPVSGLIVAVNEALLKDASPLTTDTCGEGWIAQIVPTRLEEENRGCTRRRVVLLNPDHVSAAAQQKKLAAYGCQVKTVARWEELAPLLETQGHSVLVMDAARFADDGPAMVEQINMVAPSTRVVLVAPAGCKLEAAYRANRIFYYAVEPFADNEIAEILDAAFRMPPRETAEPERRKAPPGALCSILITNRNGKKVRLVVQAKLLRREDGLGAMIRYKLLDRLYPMETVSGDADLEPANIVKMAAACDRLVVLMTKDVGRLPGSLVRDTKAEFVSISGDGAGKVTFLAVQPDDNGGLAGFDARTAAALAEHVVNDMAGY